MPSGRQATGANTTPLGSLNPAFMGQGPRPSEGSMLLPHLANMSPQPQQAQPPAQWPPQAAQKQSSGNSPPKDPGSWEPSRMRNKSRSRSRGRREKSRERSGRRSRSRDRSRRGRRSRSRSRSRRSRDRKKGRRSNEKSRDRSRNRSNSKEGESVALGADDKPKRKRRSRWGAQDDLEFIPGMPVTLPPNLTDEQQRLYLIHVKIEEINKKLKSGDFSSEITRSPSPEPIYNSEGKRLNTREFRIRKKLEDERQALIQEAMRLNPNFKPAGGDVPQVRHQEKVMIPVMANPNVNFMGLLIGPRGNSLKKLEEETGTKIMIRGKGSVKEGKGRKDGLPMPGEDEDLHALISAPTEEGLHNAIKRITSIINDAIQSPDNTNELKKLQMRELALLNGTLRDEDMLKCRNCGALDHRDWECQGDRNVTQMVTCQRCGGGGHLASDCQVDLSDTDNFIPDKAKMDSEYMSLMAELGVAEEGAGLSSANAPPPAPSGGGHDGPQSFAPRQANVQGGGPRPRYAGLGSEGRGGFNNRGGPPRGGGPPGRGGGYQGNRPPWQNNNSSGPPNNSRGGYRGGPSGGGYNSRGGFQPRGGPPRNPAPWQQPNNFGNNFGPRGGYPGFPPPPAVNIPSTKPPPPPEEPPEPAPWEQNAGGAGSWGMMPPVMPPWMAGSMPGVQIPPVPPAPPSQPPPPQ
ncbi:uncharacterized protein LOC134823453 isoform X1 [Bolinopsis microptera]|uniref:uncharacterized protein LOC134823453 isoform X1 n=2 Tax=Bolinopsis microptera TaxID=2820187 RepID=UPI003078D03E